MMQVDMMTAQRLRAAITEARHMLGYLAGAETAAEARNYPPRNAVAIYLDPDSLAELWRGAVYGEFYRDEDGTQTFEGVRLFTVQPVGGTPAPDWRHLYIATEPL